MVLTGDKKTGSWWPVFFGLIFWLAMIWNEQVSGLIRRLLRDVAHP
jgi:hypothetical protein